MNDLAAQVARFVADEAGAEQIGPATWRFPFAPTDGGEFSVIVSVIDELLLAYGTRIDPVPSERIGAMYELIGDLNSELTIAWFDCERRTGVVSARAAIDTNEIAVTEVLISNVVGAAAEAMARFGSAIDAVASGEITAADIRRYGDDGATRSSPLAKPGRPVVNIDEMDLEALDAFLLDDD